MRNGTMQARVKKGEKSALVVFWKFFDKETQEDRMRKPEGGGEGNTRRAPMARLPADHCLAANGLVRDHPVSYWAYLRASLSWPSSRFFAVAAIPAARSFAIRAMSFTGTGLVSGKWTVPFRSS
jgi:hypothetical protein